MPQPQLDTAQAARHIADEIKAGQTSEVGKSLADEFWSLGSDREQFGKFLAQVKADNAQDQKADKYLPGIDYEEQPSGNYTVDVTNSGRVFGNVWRNHQEVFVEVSGKDDFVGQDNGKITRDTTVVGGRPSISAPGNALPTSHEGQMT
jgi:hypothetical protein